MSLDVILRRFDDFILDGFIGGVNDGAANPFIIVALQLPVSLTTTINT
jgi:hypothetical protein